MTTALLQLLLWKQITVGIIGLILLSENHQHRYSALGRLQAVWLAALAFSPLLTIVYATVCRCFAAPVLPPIKIKGFTGGYALVIAANCVSVLLIGFKWPF
jgi:hypothetical protein